ncbi:glutathione S-transferase family protein [Candidatus Uabimicrobium sp. HlEnr_7]|uniref:glutathione S-transferase family protein n=1 Tax=Candidatus Uabimicrobium helgolandensis TaxID=3095367 RepID=UPI00355673D2
MKLYQFAISHYCEKIRWALDYKKLDYELVNLVPGLHTLTTRKMVSQTHLPILVDEGKVIQNSSSILDYLDEKYPKHSLLSDKLDEVRSWEKYADEQIGINLRRYFYAHLLKHKNIVAPMLSSGVSPIKKTIFSVMFPKVRKVMRQRMNINDETGLESKKQLIKAIDKVGSHLENRDFMVGNSFSRADLTVAALLAPIYQPQGYGLKWPLQIPDDLQRFRDEHMSKILWVNKIYENYR